MIEVDLSSHNFLCCYPCGVLYILRTDVPVFQLLSHRPYNVGFEISFVVILVLALIKVLASILLSSFRYVFLVPAFQPSLFFWRNCTFDLSHPLAVILWWSWWFIAVFIFFFCPFVSFAIFGMPIYSSSFIVLLIHALSFF